MPLTDQIDVGRRANWKYLTGLGRALAGASMFSLPLLMTMEMWWLGFYLEPQLLLQFAVVNFLVLIGLSSVSGFESTKSWGDDVMDAFAAYGVAVIWSASILWVLGVIAADQPAHEIVGKVVLQAVPASFGAMLAGKQLGTQERDPRAERDRASYWGQLFLMLAGALFLGFSVAPTEEMILISFQMGPLHAVLLMLVSIAALHAMVYTLGFKGERRPPGPTTFWNIFLTYTMVDYAIAVLVALYLLWTFGRLTGTDEAQIASMVTVLAFPGALGAALARLVV